MTNIILRLFSRISVLTMTRTWIYQKSGKDGREYVYYPDNHVALVDRETQEYTLFSNRIKNFRW